MIDFPDNPVEGQQFIDADEVLWTYENKIWINSPKGIRFPIGQLNDVTDTSDVENDALQYSGTEFINTQLPEPVLPNDHKNYPTGRYIFCVKNNGTYVGTGSYTKNNYANGLTSVVFDPDIIVNIYESRIDIPASGFWQINLRTNIDARDNQQQHAIYINDAYAISISQHYLNTLETFDDERFISNNTVLLELTSGDNISVWTKSDKDVFDNTETEFSGFLKRAI